MGAMDAKPPPIPRPLPPRWEAGPAPFGPRVLWVSLGGLRPGGPAQAPERLDPAGELPTPEPLTREAAGRFLCWGGTALGLVLLARAEEERARAHPMVLAVGEAVARATPTAARASVLARSPLTGRLGQGQVGGDLGSFLVSRADALVLTGRTRVKGAVLVIDDTGARLESVPQLAGRNPTERLDLAARAFGPGATLTFGIGAERELHFASLASGSASPLDDSASALSGAGTPAPSLVGRGGLGTVLARTGLSAVHVLAPDRSATDEKAVAELWDDSVRADLRAALLLSPRLAHRSEAGTLELFRAEATRRGADPGRSLQHSLEPAERSGCRGCPTPCGWNFVRTEKEHDSPRSPATQPGRFSALRALGSDIGLATGGESLELLARADELAIDAKELGSLMELTLLAIEGELLAGPSPRGDLAGLLGLVDELVLGIGQRFSRSLWDASRRGAAAFARKLGLEHNTLGGTSARRLAANDGGVYPGQAGGLAALIGQCTSAGGTDPMRTFPFLVEALDQSGLERMLGVGLPEGADDPRRPEGKGLLAFWHQNLVAGLDLSGFCAFSAAGLLADGVTSLDELAQRILPRALAEDREGEWGALSPGGKLLAAGANLALFARHLDALWERDPGHPRAQRDAPDWAAEALAHPELLGAHRRLRGIDECGRPSREALGWLGSPRPGRLTASPPTPVDAAGDARTAAEVDRNSAGARGVPPPGPAGTLWLAADGELAHQLERALGPVDPRSASFPFELPGPQRLDRCLRNLAARSPDLARQLLVGERLLPAVWRGGRRLRADTRVRPGDRLELLLAISGG